MKQKMTCEHKGCNATDVKDYTRKSNDSWYGEPIALCSKHSKFFAPCLRIRTQQLFDKWMCFVTYSGYDYNTEGESIEIAQSKFKDLLKTVGANINNFFFDPPIYAVPDYLKTKPSVTYSSSRIDNL